MKLNMHTELAIVCATEWTRHFVMAESDLICDKSLKGSG